MYVDDSIDIKEIEMIELEKPIDLITGMRIFSVSFYKLFINFLNC